MNLIGFERDYENSEVQFNSEERTTKRNFSGEAEAGE